MAKWRGDLLGEGRLLGTLRQTGTLGFEQHGLFAPGELGPHLHQAGLLGLHRNASESIIRRDWSATVVRDIV